MQRIAPKSRIALFAVVALLIALGLARLVSSSDSDGDGVPVRADRCAGTPAGRPVDSDGCCDAARAFPRAVHALLGDPSLDVGEAWLLQKLLSVYPDRDLGLLVELAVERLANDKAARLINPAAPRLALPADPGRGTTRLMYYILAAAGAPESRAVDFIADYVAGEETGYVLTHQFLALEWAQATGLELPESVRLERQTLLERIGEEHAADPEFSDLFAERAALLLAFASPPPAEAARWIDTILAAQLPDGRWVHTAPSSLKYDGQTAVARHPWTHTSGFATAAIGFYLVVR